MGSLKPRLRPYLLWSLGVLIIFSSLGVWYFSNNGYANPEKLASEYNINNTKIGDVIKTNGYVIKPNLANLGYHWVYGPEYWNEVYNDTGYREDEFFVLENPGVFCYYSEQVEDDVFVVLEGRILLLTDEGRTDGEIFIEVMELRQFPENGDVIINGSIGMALYIAGTLLLIGGCVLNRKVRGNSRGQICTRGNTKGPLEESMTWEKVGKQTTRISILLLIAPMVIIFMLAGTFFPICILTLFLVGILFVMGGWWIVMRDILSGEEEETKRLRMRNSRTRSMQTGMVLAIIPYSFFTIMYLLRLARHHDDMYGGNIEFFPMVPAGYGVLPEYGLQSLAFGFILTGLSVFIIMLLFIGVFSLQREIRNT